MATKTNGFISTIHSSLCSLSSLFLFTLISILSLSLFFLFLATYPSKPISSQSLLSQTTPQASIKVYVADLPRSLNYGLLDAYWSLQSDSRLGSEADREIRRTQVGKTLKFPPYPENPLIKQYSAEYWIMGDLLTPEKLRYGSFAKRVFDVNEADVVFVPFFATISAEMQLGVGKGVFRKKEGNEDYERQRQVMEFVRGTDAWKRSGGRDHVFVLTGNGDSFRVPFFDSLVDVSFHRFAMWVMSFLC